MTDIYLSYSRHDQDTARLLARALAKFGWSVWLDEERLVAGQNLRDSIEKALTASRCVIVLWSPGSVNSAFVRDEALFALEQKKLVPVVIEEVAIPLAFAHYHHLLLLDWHGDTNAEGFRALARTLADRMGLAQTAMPVERPRASAASSERLDEMIPGERRALNEGKLILVGFGGVGKTTLVNRMVLGRPFNKNEAKTDGIQISDWRMSKVDGKWTISGEGAKRQTGRWPLLKRSRKAKVATADPEALCMHVWDFGGQEIMHATHQFFLTTRALYLLVLSGRQGREDSDAEYWLDMIATFGADSPVIVVLNKIKQLPFDINRRALQSKHPNVRAFLETDCEDDTGLDALTDAVQDEIDRMPHLRDTFPANWFAVKDQLTSMPEDFVSFDEFRKICERAGERDPQSQDTLASFLHTLGVALNFRDDPRLRDLHVLKPKWVTEGIYAILNNKAVAVGRGELTLAQLSKVLDPKRYPQHRHPFLFELMRKFELCIRFPDDEDRFLVPELLDKQEPASIEWAASDALAFEYHYTTIVPEGLLPRFIVRTSALSMNQSRWRSGVVLEFKENVAVVKADGLARVVRIQVRGPKAGRRTLLAVIRSDFEHIHRSYGIQPKEMAPIEGHPGALVSYDKLLVLEKGGVETLQEVYGDAILQLHVKTLLDGVDLEGVRPARTDPDRRQGVVEAFISFSHKDEALRAELDTHLKLLRRLSVLNTWSDRCITAGDDWKGQIHDAVERANLILFLISADFIASDYCWDVEMQRALERADDGAAVIVPIIVRTCLWKEAPFARFQALPENGKAVTAATARSAKDKAWTNVAEGIAGKAKLLQQRSA
ncbi:MAG TPA: COR domain-containing protein [Vicinamibacterales bacterium]